MKTCRLTFDVAINFSLDFITRRILFRNPEIFRTKIRPELNFNVLVNRKLNLYLPGSIIITFILYGVNRSLY